VLLNTSLTEAMAGEGLRKWIDFSADGDQVILYGTLRAGKNRLSQGYLCWIDLDSGSALTRLVPLSQLGLEEANNAEDEQVQYLEHNPNQQGQLLTALAGQPLVVSLVYRSRRLAIQLDEGTEQLPVYTEARDERRAQASKEAQRAQRKADREARKQTMNSDVAAAIGVSEEDYAAMSNKERKEAMVRSGDMNAILASALKQAELAKQQMAAQQGANGQTATVDMTQEMSAAIAQAQKAMANAGLTTPETQASSAAADPAPAATGGASKTTAGSTGQNTLALDANLYGTVKFEHPDGAATTLSIVDRQTGQEWLRKDYPDGSIYEYLDFGRYQAPLNRIAVIFLDGNEETIEELTPVVAD
ncbi:MAG: hypothetical protein WBS20_05410, partial [Lysobacterales bacterium]